MCYYITTTNNNTHFLCIITITIFVSPFISYVSLLLLSSVLPFTYFFTITITAIIITSYSLCLYSNYRHYIHSVLFLLLSSLSSLLPFGYFLIITRIIVIITPLLLLSSLSPLLPLPSLSLSLLFFPNLFLNNQPRDVTVSCSQGSKVSQVSTRGMCITKEKFRGDFPFRRVSLL